MAMLNSHRKYTLKYFNSRGLGEVIRLLFAQADIEYEDMRVKREDWPTMKTETPFGKLPVLEIDGTVTLCQSGAIARYVAKLAGLAGKTDLEMAQVDMLVDCMKEVWAFHMPIAGEHDKDKKAAMMQKFVEETLPSALSNLEKLLCKNNGGKNYFLSSGLSWADILLQYTLEGMVEIYGEEPLKNVSKLKALKLKVEGLPNIAAWMKKRPVTKHHILHEA